MTLQDIDHLRALVPDIADVSDAIWTLRMVKSPSELALMERACRIAATAFDAAIPPIRPGDTERTLANRIGAEVARLGGRVAFLIVTSGPGSYHRSNGSPRDRVLETGDFVFVDLGVCYRGYHADFNRTLVVGSPTSEQRALQQTIKEITEHAAHYVVPGTTGAEVYRRVVDDCRKAGLDIRAPGRVGHGIGLNVTEPPHISLEDTAPLAAGTVTTIEPMLECNDALYCAEIIYVVSVERGLSLNVASSLHETAGATV